MSRILNHYEGDLNISPRWVSWMFVKNIQVSHVDVYFQELVSLVVEEANNECLKMGVPTLKQLDIFLPLGKGDFF